MQSDSKRNLLNLQKAENLSEMVLTETDTFQQKKRKRGLRTKAWSQKRRTKFLNML